ncbi:unnamed protein product [Ectocarpus sp. 6 AP-2014]
MAPRLIPPLLLFALLGRRGTVHASTVLFTRATRQPTVAFSELAFAVPPPAAVRPPARSPAGGAWTSRSSNRAVSTTTTGGSQRIGVCPLALTRRGRADTTATAPPPSSSLSRRRKSAAASAVAAAAAAAATRAAPARLEQLDAGSKGRRKGGRRATAAPSGQHKKKPRSSPQRKGLSPAAAAAAAVDPYPAGSAFVATPMTTTESGGGGGGTALKGDAVAPRAAAAAPAAARRPRNGTPAPGRRTGGVYTRGTARNRRGEGAKKQRYGDVSAKRAKALRTGGKAFLIVCDAESITSPELLESIDILDELGTRDVGVIYADWNKTQDWRSELFGRSKARDFKLLQRESLPPGSNPLGDDTMTAEVLALARSEELNKYEFCLLSADGSLSELAAKLRGEGRAVRGVGRRQAPKEFLDNCDTFMYIDPANRYELLDNEGLVISVALCIALAAAGQERCDWVRMKTIVNSLHAWDLGLESPNYFGYSDYDEMVVKMDAYVTGVEDTSGEVVVKVPPKPKAGEVPRGLEDVATYLYAKWVSFTNEPRMNDILLACIPACLQALAVARGEMDIAVKRFQQGTLPLESSDYLMDY